MTINEDNPTPLTGRFYIASRKLSLLYKIIAILIGIYGQILALDVLDGKFKVHEYLYYTRISNLLVLLFFIASAIYVNKKIAESGSRGPATLWPLAKGAVIIAITVTMAIYWTMLYDPADVTDVLEDYIVHLVMPLLMLFDWLLFDAKGAFKFWHPFVWLVIPYVYFGFTLVAGPMGLVYPNGKHYPYPFINVDERGIEEVLTTVLWITLGFLLFSFVLVALDRLMRGRVVK